MNAKQAARNLEVIRTLMERTTQYQLLTARAGLIAGLLALGGAFSFLLLDPGNPWHFGSVWTAVFLGALTVTLVTTLRRGRIQGERIWSRQARAVVLALAPAFFTAVVISLFFFSRGDHQWLPGIWMLCYGQAALATAAYAPPPIRSLGIASLLAGAVTLALGPTCAALMMGLVFGWGHVLLGCVLLGNERQQVKLRLHQSVA